jgi:hypothetical protein
MENLYDTFKYIVKFNQLSIGTIFFGGIYIYLKVSNEAGICIPSPLISYVALNETHKVWVSNETMLSLTNRGI